MHPIRQDILRKLILNSELRFAKLKPEDIESNHFMYYLKQLIDEGLVVKENGLYSLGKEGKQLANVISLASLKPRLQPKIMTAQVLFENGKVLIHRRRREPYIGSISLVNGKLHYGETVAEAANRELEEKTGLTADMSHTGMVYITYTENGEAVNHILSHIFTAADYDGELLSTEHSEPQWIAADKLDSLDNILPGTLEILKLIKDFDGNFFFKELLFDTPKVH